MDEHHRHRPGRDLAREHVQLRHRTRSGARYDLARPRRRIRGRLQRGEPARVLPGLGQADDCGRRSQRGAQMTMTTSPETTRVADAVYLDVLHFLNVEAELLDDNRFDEWLELLTEDVTYRMPVTVTRER